MGKKRWICSILRGEVRNRQKVKERISGVSVSSPWILLFSQWLFIFLLGSFLRIRGCPGYIWSRVRIRITSCLWWIQWGRCSLWCATRRSGRLLLQEEKCSWHQSCCGRTCRGKGRRGGVRYELSIVKNELVLLFLLFEDRASEARN